MGPEDDAVIQVSYQDRGELQERGLLTYVLVGLLAFGNIAKNDGEQLFALNLGLRDGSLDGEFLAVGTDTVDRTHAAHAAASSAGGTKRTNILAMFPAKARRHEAIDRRADGVGSRAAKHEFGSGVEHGN